MTLLKIPSATDIFIDANITSFGAGKLTTCVHR
jgi:hypothetical protein